MKTVSYEVVEFAAERHHGLADVQQLTGPFADDVHAKNGVCFTVEDELQPAGCVSANLPAGNLAIVRDAYFVRERLRR